MPQRLHFWDLDSPSVTHKPPFCDCSLWRHLVPRQACVHKKVAQWLMDLWYSTLANPKHHDSCRQDSLQFTLHSSGPGMMTFDSCKASRKNLWHYINIKRAATTTSTCCAKGWRRMGKNPCLQLVLSDTKEAEAAELSFSAAFPSAYLCSDSLPVGDVVIALASSAANWSKYPERQTVQ